MESKGGAGSQLVSLAVSTIVGAIYANQDKKKAEALMRQIQALDQKQQKELEEKLLSVGSLLLQEEIIFKYLSVQKHQQAMQALRNQRLLKYGLLGIAIACLAVVVIKIKSKR